MWHTQTKKNEPSLKVDKEKYKNTNVLSLKDIIVWHISAVAAAEGFPLETIFCILFRIIIMISIMIVGTRVRFLALDSGRVFEKTKKKNWDMLNHVVFFLLIINLLSNVTYSSSFLSPLALRDSYVIYVL